MRPAPARAAGRRAGGFTLLELLVAVSILAIVAIMAWRGLAALSATRARLEPQNDAVRATLAGLGQIERDLAQVPLNARLFALPAQAVRVLSVNGQPGLQILRLAPGPDGGPASALQSVFYVVRGGALERQSGTPQRNYVAAAGGALESVVLVPGIDALQVRVWRANVGWITPGSDADVASAPGIEVRLLRSDGSSVRRVYAVG